VKPLVDCIANEEQKVSVQLVSVQLQMMLRYLIMDGNQKGTINAMCAGNVFATPRGTSKAGSRSWGNAALKDRAISLNDPLPDHNPLATHANTR